MVNRTISVPQVALLFVPGFFMSVFVSFLTAEIYPAAIGVAVCVVGGSVIALKYYAFNQSPKKVVDSSN